MVVNLFTIQPPLVVKKIHACLCIIKGGTVYKIYKFLLQWLDYMFQVSGCLMTIKN